MRHYLSTVSLIALTASLPHGAIANDSTLDVDLQEALPAVSEINGKFAKSAGVWNDEAVGLGAGSITLPLGHEFGLQLDGMVGTRDGDFIGHGAAHLFWRDPNERLIGFYGSFTDRQDLDLQVGRLGLEIEQYWERVTFRSVFGAEVFDLDNPALVEPDDGFFAFSDLSFYATDNLELSIGHRYFAEQHAGALAIEYQLDQPLFGQHVALFAEGRLGENDYEAAWGGIKIYFGDDKSLIRRHREDDPDHWGEEDLFNLVEEDDEEVVVIVCDPCID